ACTGGHCDGASGLCGPKRADSEACYSDTDCQSNHCDSRICKAAKPNGQSCTDNRKCTSGYCAYSLRVCQDRCDSDSDCDTGQYCDSQSDTCQTEKADGVGCRDDEECVSGWCNPFSDQCQTKPEIGGACKDSVECYPYGYCSSGTCVRRIAPGESCSAL